MISPTCRLPVALILQVSATSPQHRDVICIDETNIFFILLTIILQASDPQTKGNFF